MVSGRDRYHVNGLVFKSFVSQFAVFDKSSSEAPYNHHKLMQVLEAKS